MRIVLAPDSFKESLTAAEAAEAMAAGVRDVVPGADCVLVPMADGGEGFSATVAAALGASWHTATVTGPLGEPVTAGYAIDRQRRLAVLDVAAAIGLDLVAPGERDIMRADTYGVGELVQAALVHDVDEIVIGLGGSATNDGGAGLLRALGVRLSDAAGQPVAPGPAGLARLAAADASGLDEQLRSVRLRLACDVDNPLLGERGASAVFGPQKGASAGQVSELDGLLAGLVQVLGERAAGLAGRPGAGAAGGLGFAFQYLGAEPEPGVGLVAELTGLAEAVEGADLVLVGEGSIDAQTLSGKTPYGVARIAATAGVPVIAFAGRIGPGAEVLLSHGFAALVPIVPGVMDLPAALTQGGANLRRAVATALRLVLLEI